MINLKFNNTEFKSAFFQNNGNISLIFGKPGSGKNALTNCINLSRQNNESGSFIIDLFGCFNSTLSELQEQYNVIDNKSGDIVMNTSSNLSINPLDLSFGFDSPNKEDFLILHTFLSSVLYENHNTNLNNEDIINYIIDNIYNNKKYYHKGNNHIIDFKLHTYNIHNNKISWRVLRNIFISHNEEQLAFMAHYNSMPVIDDIYSFISSEPFFYKFNKRVNISDIKNKIEQFNNNNPYFNNITNIQSTENPNFGVFSVDNKSSYNIIATQIVFFSYLYRKISFAEIAKENISDIKSKDVRKFINSFKISSERKNKIIIEEFHRSSGYFYTIPFYENIINNIYRRKNIDLILSSQLTSTISYSILEKINAFYILDISTYDIENTKWPHDFNKYQLIKYMDYLKTIKRFHREDINDDYSMPLLIINKNTINYDYINGFIYFDIKDYWDIALNKQDQDIVKKLSTIFRKDKIKEILSSNYPEGRIMDNDNPKIIANKLIERYL